MNAKKPRRDITEGEGTPGHGTDCQPGSGRAGSRAGAAIDPGGIAKPGASGGRGGEKDADTERHSGSRGSGRGVQERSTDGAAAAKSKSVSARFHLGPKSVC